MRKSSKVVSGFAGLGFVLPLLLLAFYAIADHFGRYPSTDPLLYLCPSSVASMALDHASLSTALVVWLMISASNAVLYAVIPFAVVLVYRIFRPTGVKTGSLLR